MDKVSEIWFLRPEINANDGWTQVQQGFSSIFLPILFAIFDDFSKFLYAFGNWRAPLWKIIKNLAQMKKNLVQIALNLLLKATSKTRNPTFEN